MEAHCSVTTPPAKIPKLSCIGMAQPGEPMEIAAAGTSEIGVYTCKLYSDTISIVFNPHICRKPNMWH